MPSLSSTQESAGLAPQEAKSPFPELWLRVFSAVVMIPPVILLIYLGGVYFQFFMAIATVILIAEIFLATNKSLYWTVVGAVYIAIVCYALIVLRSDNDVGFETVCWLFVLVWFADTGAFITGRALGGPKLAPKLSPKKTWSGFFGAVVFAALIGIATAHILGLEVLWRIAAISGFLGGLSQFGDLLESWVKRRFDRKDMSSLIPGHGGLADRVDSLAAAAIGAWVLDGMTTESLLKWL